MKFIVHIWDAVTRWCQEQFDARKGVKFLGLGEFTMRHDIIGNMDFWNPMFVLSEGFARAHGLHDRRPKTQSTAVENVEVDMAKLAAFRYRTEDALRSVTRHAVKEARLAEIKRELMHSKKLAQHFEANPDDLAMLRHDKPLAKTRKLAHLALRAPRFIHPPPIHGGDLRFRLEDAAQDARRPRGVVCRGAGCSGRAKCRGRGRRRGAPRRRRGPRALRGAARRRRGPRRWRRLRGRPRGRGAPRAGRVPPPAPPLEQRIRSQLRARRENRATDKNQLACKAVSDQR